MIEEQFHIFYYSTILFKKPRIYICGIYMYLYGIPATYNGELIPSILLRLLSRAQPDDMQSAAAKW